MEQDNLSIGSLRSEDKSPSRISEQLFDSSYDHEQGLCLSNEDRDLLELKIYTPYFISNSTVIEYHDSSLNEPEKLSIMDIL